MDIMLKEEKVKVDTLYGHGGYFKTKGVGQLFAAAATNAPIAVMETAGEGGAWGIAVLAAYMVNKEADMSLSDYLGNVIFAGNKGTVIEADASEVAGYEAFLEQYKKGLAIEKAAVDCLY